MTFKDKVVWITGSSSGIGEHLAYAFAEEGAKLVLTARNREELERVRHNCGADKEVLLLPADVTDFAQMQELTRQVIEQFGYLNILINNAGISQRAPAADTQLEVDRQIMDVNFFGAVALTKSVLPYLRQQRFGQLIVISSILGKIGTPQRSAYAASKHALQGFFDSLRAELADDGISVTVLCPGYVQTNVSINALKGDGSKYNIMGESIRNGMDPSIFARKAMRAIARQKNEVIIAGPRETLAVYLKRFFPGLLARIVRSAKVT